MRFIHLADVHLADSSSFDDDLGAFIRAKVWQSFENIFRANRDVDFALIAGDLFERSYFSSKDFKRLFNIFEDFGKDIYYVTGNHDYFDAYTRVLLKQKPANLYVFTDTDLSYFEKNGLRVYGLSYTDRIYDKDFAYNLSLDDGYFNILLAHGDISQSPTSYLDLDSKKLGQIGFDYIGLGHIHKAFSQGNIHYPGSIEPLDFNHQGNFGYIIYDGEGVKKISSQSLDFVDFDLDYVNFSNVDSLIDYINDRLGDRENIVRVKIRSKDQINTKKIQNSIRAVYSFIDLSQTDYNNDLASIYPDSLLANFEKSLADKDDEISKLALSLGSDAILRSQK